MPLLKAGRHATTAPHPVSKQTHCQLCQKGHLKQPATHCVSGRHTASQPCSKLWRLQYCQEPSTYIFLVDHNSQILSCVLGLETRLLHCNPLYKTGAPRRSDTCRNVHSLELNVLLVTHPFWRSHPLQLPLALQGQRHSLYGSAQAGHLIQ